MIRTLGLVFVLVTIAIGLSSCTNTVRGVGTDIEKVGKEIQRSTK
jgi:predicted small secreted protein